MWSYTRRGLVIRNCLMHSLSHLVNEVYETDLLSCPPKLVCLWLVNVFPPPPTPLYACRHGAWPHGQWWCHVAADFIVLVMTSLRTSWKHEASWMAGWPELVLTILLKWSSRGASISQYSGTLKLDYTPFQDVGRPPICTAFQKKKKHHSIRNCEK